MRKLEGVWRDKLSGLLVSFEDATYARGDRVFAYLRLIAGAFPQRMSWLPFERVFPKDQEHNVFVLTTKIQKDVKYFRVTGFWRDSDARDAYGRLEERD